LRETRLKWLGAQIYRPRIKEGYLIDDSRLLASRDWRLELAFLTQIGRFLSTTRCGQKRSKH